MKALLLAGALALAPVAAMAAPVEGAAAYTIARSRVLSLTAADGHAYRVMVAWPEGTPPPDGWPVVTVLDGEDNFALVTQTLRRLARAGARSGIADAVVVAVESGDLRRRVYDYTPATPGWSIPAGAPASGLKTGGANAFLEFLTNTLRPRIAREWKVDPARQALIGHSFGGLLGLHASLTRPGLFASVVAVSPSLWYGDDLLTREIAAAGVGNRIRVMLAEGDGRTSAGGTPTIERFAADFARAQPADQIKVLSLPGQSHGSTMLAALVPALDFMLGAGQ